MYVRINRRRFKIDLDEVCVFLFQCSAIADGIFGFDESLFVFSKAIILAFMALTLIKSVTQGGVRFGRGLIAPALFMALTIFSCFWAYDSARAVLQLKTQLQLYLLFFCVYMIYTGKTANVKKYLDALLIIGIGLAILAVARYGVSGIMNGLRAGDRIGGEIENENTFGMAFSQATMVAFYYFLKNSKRKIRIAYLIAMIIFTFFALSSGSKKATVMIFVGLFGISALEFGIKRIGKTLLICVAVTILLLLLLRLPIFSTINTRLTIFFTERDDASDIIRASMIADGMELFKERPLFGYSLQNFGVITARGTYSHNNMVELLVSVGAIGFVIYYAIYVRTLLWSWKYGVKKKNYIYTLLFILAGISMVFGYGMVQFYAKKTWILLGVMAAAPDNPRFRLEEMQYEQNQTGIR